MKIALQLYSIRDAGDLDAQLALAKRCGFDGVESVATHGLAPKAFADKLQAHGLQLASMHAALALLERDATPLVEACHLSGCPLLVMPSLPLGERPATAEGWRDIGRRLARLSGPLQSQGLQLAYHNHDWEFLRYGEHNALEWIFSQATPNQVRWEADLGWLCRAGADPWLWLERFADRLACVHAKDIAPTGTALAEDGWATLGQGILPWAELLAQLKSRVNLVIFEHDRPQDFEATLRGSRAFLQQHLA